MVYSPRVVDIVKCPCHNFFIYDTSISTILYITEGPGFKSQSRRCRVTVLGKLFTPIVPLFAKQQNW